MAEDPNSLSDQNNSDAKDENAGNTNSNNMDENQTPDSDPLSDKSSSPELNETISEDPDENPPLPPNLPLSSGRVRDTEIHREMSKSYIDYAMSVIVGRAIPDVRDGLKPVQRRILYSMNENGFLYNRPHKKCARIVGDTMGRYHPHGDQSVYQTLVRMAQDFSVRYQLIDGQGNFGSVDGDNAAAMRYTEARMAKITNEMLEDLNKDTVDFQDNFDGSLKEPIFLPAKLPLLLLNGATGIAVGMSTNIAPHNLTEMANAIAAAIDMGPDNLEPEDVMKYMKGPDFPTGGIIMGRSGIWDAISTGRGSIVIRSKTEIVQDGAGRNKDAIIVTEIPYMVNKARLIENIAGLVHKGVTPEISDIRDESDRTGMRIVIEMKQNADANAVLHRLFQRTQLQNAFHVLNLALVDKGLKPKILNYAELLKEFIRHREMIVRRRTEYELKKAKDRLHIIDGLLIAIANIDEIVQLIKNSQDKPDASQKLQAKYALSEIQAEEILKMPLSRLTNLQIQRLEEEKQEILIKIEELTRILSSEQIRLNIVKQETLELAVNYDDPRRSEIQDDFDEECGIDIVRTIPEEDCVFMLTKNQAIKRMSLSEYQSQNRGGRGKRGMKMREEDIVDDMFIANSHATILLFTQKGRMYSIPAYKIPLGSRNAKGKALINYVELRPGEIVVDFTAVLEFDTTRSLIMVTKDGKTKKVSLNQFLKIRRTGIIFARIQEEDQVVRVKLCRPDDHVFIATAKGFAIHFEENELRPTGRVAMGVKGLTLRPDDYVVDLVVNKADSNIITITQNGYGKHSSLDRYRLTHRAGKGVINIKFYQEDDKVIAVKSINEDMNLLVASVQGIIIRIRSSDIRETGRAAKGVIVMRLDDDDKVTSVALCEIDELEESIEESIEVKEN